MKELRESLTRTKMHIAGDPKKDCGNKKGAVAAPKRISQCTDHSMGLPFAEMILSLTPENF
jgi:hypothetical protein